MKKTKKYISGTTLIELMVALIILGFIMFVVQAFFATGIRFFRQSQIKSEIQRNARTTLSLINRKLREAKATTIIIDRLNSSQPPCSRLSFQTIDSESLSFFQSGLNLCMADLTRGSTRQISGDLRIMTFTYPMLYDDKIISISICFEKGTGSLEQKALQMSVEKVRLMNE